MTQLNLNDLASNAKSNNVIFLANLEAVSASTRLKDYQKASIASDEKEKKFQFRDESGNLLVYIAEESEEKCRKQGHQLFTTLSSLKISELAIYLESDEKKNYAFVEGLSLSSYSFDKYKSKKEDKNFDVYLSGLTAASINEIKALCKANFTARTLVNEPHSFLNATQYSKEITNLGQEYGFSVKVLNKAAIQEHKMGGLLAVNKGSIQEPTFNILEYKGPNACNAKPIILVGKGVMYDTGGLSLKPTPGSMDLMKSDMAGSAAVVGAFCAIASQKLALHVIGLIPATDNRPGLDAVVPGDVITMMSGKSVEVLNTDAEGRLVLADALHYAKQFEPEFVIDLATLTGAAARAIGSQGIVCMGNASDTFKNSLKESGFAVHERLVEFPLWEEYESMIKSDIADIKNIGGAAAGATTAGLFLQHFVDYPWMHLDIAGAAFLTGADSYRGKNGTGVGVRLIYNFLKKRTELNGTF